MDKKLDALYDLCETVSHEIEEANEKIRKAGGELSAGDIEYIDKLTHTMKSLKTTIAMIEAEENGYSNRYYYEGESMDGMSNRGMSNARGRGRSARRDNRGRYSSERGYSRDDAKEEFILEVYEIMEKAPDEKTRKKFERFISEMQ